MEKMNRSPTLTLYGPAWAISVAVASTVTMPAFTARSVRARKLRMRRTGWLILNVLSLRDWSLDYRQPDVAERLQYIDAVDAAHVWTSEPSTRAQHTVIEKVERPRPAGS